MMDDAELLSRMLVLKVPPASRTPIFDVPDPVRLIVPEFVNALPAIVYPPAPALVPSSKTPIAPEALLFWMMLPFTTLFAELIVTTAFDGVLILTLPLGELMVMSPS